MKNDLTYDVILICLLIGQAVLILIGVLNNDPVIFVDAVMFVLLDIFIILNFIKYKKL